VTRKSDLSDRRLTLIEATPQGRRILAAGRARRVEKLATAIAALTTRERTELTRGADVLQTVIAGMSAAARDVSKL